MRWVLLALLALVGVADARPHPAGFNPQSLPSLTGLHVSGNKLLNGSGQQVFLHGVDKSGTEYECLGSSTVIFDGPSDANSVTVLQTWGINVVRLPLNESCWLGINGALPSAATYQAAIEAYVTLLTNANIAVIIDLQWVGPGTQTANDWCGGQFAPLPDNDHAPTFWTSVANAFKSNSLVIFDLYNEPWPENNADTTLAWEALMTANGNTYTVTSSNSSCATSYTPVGLQSLITTIRGTGSTNIIDVPGVQYTNTLDQWLANEPTDTLSPAQLVAAWHSYSNQGCNSVACWGTTIKSVMNSVPVIAEEIGESDCEGVYIDPLMTWMDSNAGGNSGNYLAWAWNTYNCGSFPAVISDYSGTPTGTFGYEFRNHLLGYLGLTQPPQTPLPKFSNTYPFGLAIGRATNYTAGDGTVYYPDVATTGLTVQVTNPYSMTSYTTGDTITGTSDPVLYETGRQGCCGVWTINVLNGNYTVTLGMAYTATFVANGNTGTTYYGQDQTLMGNTVGNCVWSPNPSPGGCGTVQTNPVTDQAYTISYNVSVYNQQLVIEVAQSFGAPRQTVLSSIKVATNP